MASTLKSLRALSAPSRVRLLALLNKSELTVRELTEITNMRQSGISMHLGQMQEAGRYYGLLPRLLLERRARAE